ncbi:single-stranded DNA-binding protein [Streptomyces virginiae]|uniref:single-stranded DNA-binding protein n=1 Tax=Streptomyces virginiae TaxID=1961 RepID=UPI00368A7842
MVTLVGNLTADPELRFTASGVPVAGFTIASTPRVHDRDRSEFTDGEPLFLRCTLWRQAAENAAETLTRGMRVIVTGRLKQRTFDDKEGQRRTVVEIDAEEAAPSLIYAKATVTKAHRPGSGPAASRPAAPPSGRHPPRHPLPYPLNIIRSDPSPRRIHQHMHLRGHRLAPASKVLAAGGRYAHVSGTAVLPAPTTDVPGPSARQRPAATCPTYQGPSGGASRQGPRPRPRRTPSCCAMPSCRRATSRRSRGYPSRSSAVSCACRWTSSPPVHRTTAEAILGIPLAGISGRRRHPGLVSSDGSATCLQDLSERGWPTSFLASRLRTSTQTIAVIRSGKRPRIALALDQAIQNIHGKLTASTPAEYGIAVHRSRRASTAAHQRAQHPAPPPRATPCGRGGYSRSR